MKSPIFSFDGVTGGYGGGTVVNDVSGYVEQGKVLFVLGRNGVGKSTLLNLLFGYLKLTRGSVRFKEEELGAKKPEEMGSLGITFCPQERVVFDKLSVLENLVLTRGNRDVTPFEEYFEYFPILADRLSQDAGTLSGGERKILSFVRALSEERELLMLDEPTEGVQRENMLHIANLIADKKKSGRTFVIVEQNLELLEAVGDHVLVLYQGKVMVGGRKDLISREDILQHLGV